MKYVLAVLIPLLIIGGVTFGLMYSKVGPFASTKKAAKVSKKAFTSNPATNPSTITANSKTTSNAPSYPTSTQSAPTYPASSVATAAPTPDPNSDENAAHLASVYEQMQPEDAVKILSKLPDPVVIKLLRKMDSMQVSKILPLLPVNRSVKITQELMK